MTTVNRRQSQQLATHALIELYELDTTPLSAINGTTSGGTVYSWTPGTLGGASLVFNGTTYAPLPIYGSGFEWTGQGKLPQPSIQISNVGGLVTGLVIGNGDLVGAQLTRLRVFEDNLDGQANADPTAYFEPDIFVVARKARHTNEFIEFELRASFDAQGLQLPRRQIIRDVCTHSYRYWNGTSFIQGSCPYTGTSYFNLDGSTASSPSADVCGKKLSDCQLRFGTNGNLPTRAFPGAGLSLTAQ